MAISGEGANERKHCEHLEVQYCMAQRENLLKDEHSDKDTSV